MVIIINKDALQTSINYALMLYYNIYNSSKICRGNNLTFIFDGTSSLSHFTQVHS